MSIFKEIDMQTKFCPSCAVEKTTDKFHKAKKEKDGLQYRCIECSKQYHARRYAEQKDKLSQQIAKYRSNNKKKLAAAQNVWRKNNPDKVKQYQRISNLRKNFGLSVSDYEAIAVKQNGLCDICRQPESFVHKATNTTAQLAVDHCHKTGKVRGLLCKSCNTALGIFKDDTKLLLQAIDYLTKHNG